MRDQVSYGEKYSPAMRLISQEDANRYFDECVTHTMRLLGKTRSEAEAIERHNLSYFASHYDQETRERVERLYGSPGQAPTISNPPPDPMLEDRLPEGVGLLPFSPKGDAPEEAQSPDAPESPPVAAQEEGEAEAPLKIVKTTVLMGDPLSNPGETIIIQPEPAVPVVEPDPVLEIAQEAPAARPMKKGKRRRF